MSSDSSRILFNSSDNESLSNLSTIEFVSKMPNFEHKTTGHLPETRCIQPAIIDGVKPLQ
jgi:hypothetical protein